MHDMPHPRIVPGRSLAVVPQVSTEALLRSMRSGAFGLTIICALLQLVISLDNGNAVSVLVIMISAIATIFFAFDKSKFAAHPLPMIGIVGFGFTTHLGALYFTTLYWRPVSYNLFVPEATFGLAALSQLMLIMTFQFYSTSAFVSAFRRAVRNKIVRPLGLLDPPSKALLWVLGAIGLGVMWLTTVELRGGIEFGNVGFKFLQGFSPFYMAPFFILFAPYLFGSKTPVSGREKIAITIYFSLVVLVGIARNSRGVFAGTVLVVILTIIIVLISGRMKLRKNSLILAVFALLSAAPILGVLADLATAMVAVRSERGDVSSAQLIEQTAAAFMDAETLARFRDYEAYADGATYNEVYIPNPLLTRLVSSKTIDNNVFVVQNLNSDQITLFREALITRIVLVLPTPLLNLVDNSLRKKDYQYSSGDYYYHVVNGDELGSYRVGSSLADGWATMGFLYFPVLAIIVIVSFLIFDAFTLRAVNGTIIICPVMLFSLNAIFDATANGESVSSLITNLLRDYPQMIFLYWVIKTVVQLALNYTVVFGRKLPVAG